MDGGPLALFFAGTRPDRTSALILANTAAKFVAAADYQIGIPAEVGEALLARSTRAGAPTPCSRYSYPAVLATSGSATGT